MAEKNIIFTKSVCHIENKVNIVEKNMFEILENRFTANQSVKYHDQYENIIRIFTTKNMDQLTIKITCPDSLLKIDPVHIDYPFDAEGVHFDVHSKKEIAPEQFREEYEGIQVILHDCVPIIERWVQICIDIAILLQNGTLSTLGEQQERQIVAKILNELECFEETKEFATLYSKLLYRH